MATGVGLRIADDECIAAVVTEDGTVRIVERDALLHMSDDGDAALGGPAPTGHAHSIAGFVRAIGDPAGIDVDGGEAYRAEDLLATAMFCLIDLTTEHLSGPAEFYATHPAQWTPEVVRGVREALDYLGLKSVALLGEDELPPPADGIDPGRSFATSAAEAALVAVLATPGGCDAARSDRHRELPRRHRCDPRAGPADGDRAGVFGRDAGNGAADEGAGHPDHGAAGRGGGIAGTQAQPDAAADRRRRADRIAARRRRGLDGAAWQRDHPAAADLRRAPGIADRVTDARAGPATAAGRRVAHARTGRHHDARARTGAIDQHRSAADDHAGTHDHRAVDHTRPQHDPPAAAVPDVPAGVSPLAHADSRLQLNRCGGTVTAPFARPCPRVMR
ncbi:hypothetical protein [Nocardia sp. MW-W600-9]